MAGGEFQSPQRNSPNQVTLNMKVILRRETVGEHSRWIAKCARCSGVGQGQAPMEAAKMFAWLLKTRISLNRNDGKEPLRNIMRDDSALIDGETKLDIHLSFRKSRTRNALSIYEVSNPSRTRSNSERKLQLSAC